LARYNAVWGRPEAEPRAQEWRQAMTRLLPDALWASPPPIDLGTGRLRDSVS